jgi:hypothetical protein
LFVPGAEDYGVVEPDAAGNDASIEASADAAGADAGALDGIWSVLVMSPHATRVGSAADL